MAKEGHNFIEGGEENVISSGINLSDLGTQISIVRKMLDCTQTVFSNTIGITPQTLSSIERGKFTLTNNLAAKIYFSLFEVISDDELLKLYNFQPYQIQCIKDLMEKLLLYMRSINSELKSTIENFRST